MSLRKRIGNMSIGAKLSLLLIALAIVAFAGLTLLATTLTTSTLDAKGAAEIASRTGQIVKTIDLVNRELRDAAVPLNKLFADMLPERLALDPARTVDVAGAETPTLWHGRQALNLDFDAVDRFTKATGGVATIFARKGDDFVRITTSLRKENGERAAGTMLGKAHPAYAKAMAGEPYIGRATLFGKDYMTRYLPVKSADGQVIAILFTARDFMESLALLKSAVAAEKVGETGYFFVVDANPGPGYGNLIVHPTNAGKSSLGFKDSVTGHEFMKEALEKKSGRIDYWFTDAARGEKDARHKFAVFNHYPEWNWVVLGSTYVDEFVQDAVALRNALIVVAIVVLLLLAGTLIWAVRAMVRRPLAQALSVAERVAAGDLTVEIRAESNDEVGQLLRGLDRMQAGLRQVVARIQTSAEAIGSATHQIAAGNADLSRRTEAEASSLEETASSMEELSSTVKQNSENAVQADQLVVEASRVATRGGAVVGEVVTTMSVISKSSKRIADIIGVIDGIAFQTNILALNASVEAARAGEQGRGFAVVASEVRNLAQRSAAAAKEIKALITGSVGDVEAGSKLVLQAGQTMEEVVASIKRVTAIMNEITAASTEQSSGIAQVHEAVAHLDQATQQNAALAEESAAAAESLQEQARQLSAAVAVFKVGRGEGAVPDRALGVAAAPTRVVGATAGVPEGANSPGTRRITASAAPTGTGGGAATATTGGYQGPERRGSDRAKNVTRPKFGVPGTSLVHKAAPPSRQHTGTDDGWAEF